MIKGWLELVVFAIGVVGTLLVFFSASCAPTTPGPAGVTIYTPEPGVRCYAIAPYDSISCVVKP